MGFEARHATGNEIAEVSLTLAKAFQDDPIKLHLTGGKELPVAKVLPFFDAFLRIQLPHELVYTTPGFEGAAVWAPVGEWKVPFSSIVKYTPRFVKLYGKLFISNLMLLGDLEKKHPKEPHYYLEFIGTDPAHQGKGVGTALMEPVLAKADEEGVGAYLESSKESNLAFYNRFGFQTREVITHRRNGPQQWLMWRDPR